MTDQTGAAFAPPLTPEEQKELETTAWVTVVRGKHIYKIHASGGIHRNRYPRCIHPTSEFYNGRPPLLSEQAFLAVLLACKAMPDWVDKEAGGQR